MKPAEIPKKAKKPNLALLSVGGLFLAILLAVLSAGAADLAGGRFVETWQVTRKLGIPLLGDVTPP
jgi:hypothetical protein